MPAGCDLGPPQAAPGGIKKSVIAISMVFKDRVSTSRLLLSMACMHVNWSKPAARVCMLMLYSLPMKDIICNMPNQSSISKAICWLKDQCKVLPVIQDDKNHQKNHVHMRESCFASLCRAYQYYVLKLKLNNCKLKMYV